MNTVTPQSQARGDQSVSRSQTFVHEIWQRLHRHAQFFAVCAAVFVLFAILGLLQPLAALVACFVLCAATVVLAPSPLEADGAEAEASNSANAAIDATEAASLPAIIEALPEPVALLDSSGTIRMSNNAFRDAFRSTPVGASALIRFRAPEAQDVIRTAVEQRLGSRTEFADRGRLERWFDMTAAPIGKLDRAPGPCVLYFADRSESKRLERMRSDFVGNASHELRTPLTSLKGYLETLAGPARDDEAARERFIPIMLEQADRMERLIDDLLSLSRFETGQGRGEFEPVDLADVLLHVRSALRPLADQRGAAIEIDDEALMKKPHRVDGNGDELIQLFENLVENAIKYGGRDTHVSLTVQTQTSAHGRPHVEVAVADNGPGIAEQHLPRLTERFYRLDAQTSREMQGTGLGLAIVKHILTRHDGTLSIESTVGKGSRFTVTLPLLDGEISTKTGIMK